MEEATTLESVDGGTSNLAWLGHSNLRPIGRTDAGPMGHPSPGIETVRPMRGPDGAMARYGMAWHGLGVGSNLDGCALSNDHPRTVTSHPYQSFGRTNKLTLHRDSRPGLLGWCGSSYGVSPVVVGPGSRRWRRGHITRRISSIDTPCSTLPPPCLASTFDVASSLVLHLPPSPPLSLPSIPYRSRLVGLRTGAQSFTDPHHPARIASLDSSPLISRAGLVTVLSLIPTDQITNRRRQPARAWFSGGNRRRERNSTTREERTIGSISLARAWSLFG